MFFRRPARLVATLPVLLAFAAKASDRDTLELPRRTVKPEAHGARLSAGQSEITLTPSDWEGRSLSLADLLAEQAGIETRRYGGVGSFQTASVRGATGARLLVFLDGVPLNSAGGGAVDLGKLGLEVLERIEIRKGLAPAAEGGNGMGGVLHLYTRSQRKDGQASVSAGSQNTQRHAFSGGAGVAGPSAFANLAFTRSDNDFRYLDRNHTPYNPDDDAWVKRQNSAFESFEAHAQARFSVGRDQNLRLKMAGSRNAGGLPGREGEVTRDAGFSNALTQYFLGWEKQSGRDGDQLSAELSLDEETPEFHWTQNDPVGWATGRDTTEIKNRSSRSRLQMRWAIPLRHGPGFEVKLSSLATVAQETLKPTGDHAPSDNPAWNNRRRQGALATDLSLAPDSTLAFTLGTQAEGVWDRTQGGATYYGDTLVAGERLEWNPTGRVGVLWRPGPSLSWFANAGWFYHLPSLVDRFGGRWGMVANPDLRPERGLNTEAGFRKRWAGGFLELCLFRNQITDAILYIHTANLAKPFNLDAALAQGAEFSLNQGLPLGTDLVYAATARHTQNRSGTYYRGLVLPGEPVFHHNLKLRIPLPLRLGLDYVWDFRSEVFRDPGNLQRIPDQHLHHLLLRYKPSRHLGLFLSLQNLTDTYYEDAYSAYPHPGRVFHVTLTANL